MESGTVVQRGKEDCVESDTRGAGVIEDVAMETGKESLESCAGLRETGGE